MIASKTILSKYARILCCHLDNPLHPHTSLHMHVESIARLLGLLAEETSYTQIRSIIDTMAGYKLVVYSSMLHDSSSAYLSFDLSLRDKGIVFARHTREAIYFSLELPTLDQKEFLPEPLIDLDPEVRSFARVFCRELFNTQNGYNDSYSEISVDQLRYWLQTSGVVLPKTMVNDGNVDALSLETVQLPVLKEAGLIRTMNGDDIRTKVSLDGSTIVWPDLRLTHEGMRVAVRQRCNLIEAPSPFDKPVVSNQTQDTPMSDIEPLSPCIMIDVKYVASEGGENVTYFCDHLAESPASLSEQLMDSDSLFFAFKEAFKDGFTMIKKDTIMAISIRLSHAAEASEDQS